jgi:hypothetical protein
MATRGRFRCRLAGIPAGGPYEVEIRIKGRKVRTVKDVLVGDVWILAGQSNMQGSGFARTSLNHDPVVRAFYMNDCWAPAKDPVHNMWECIDQVHIDINCGPAARPPKNAGICPGPSFGRQMFKLTRIPQGMLSCAHGGTSMEQWNPDLKKLESKSLYGAMLRRFRKNGSAVAGVLWYQGESDAATEPAAIYTQRMKHFVASLRRDLRNRNLPFVMVQLSRVVNALPEAAPPWNSVQEQQRHLPETITNCAVVPAIDLTLDDPIHISGPSQLRLGARLACAMHALLNGKKAGLPQIAMAGIRIDESCLTCKVIVDFKNVAGKLVAGSRPAGFTIVTRGGNNNIFDTELKGKSAILNCVAPVEIISSGSLHYGYGTDPYCNITDEADRSLPVFGPLQIGRLRAVTPFVQTLRVSAFHPMTGDYRKLEYPSDLESLCGEKRTFPTEFCNMRLDIAKLGNVESVCHYAVKFECEEPMKLALRAGYDGPVKIWYDKAEIFSDPAGTNPALPNDAIIRIDAASGTHELVAALGTNRGAAWGIFLRFERIDVPQRLIKLGPDHYKLPKMLG